MCCGGRHISCFVGNYNKSNFLHSSSCIPWRPPLLINIVTQYIYQYANIIRINETEIQNVGNMTNSLLAKVKVICIIHFVFFPSPSTCTCFSSTKISIIFIFYPQAIIVMLNISTDIV